MKTLPSLAWRWSIALGIAALLPVVLPAQTDMTAKPSVDTLLPPSTTLAHRDRSFLENAAKGGMKEVAVSQAVAAQLRRASVQAFANMMVSDHTSANTALAALAGSKGVELPPLDPSVAEKWSKQGAGADKAYIDEMVSDHEDAVKLFEKASRSADADIAGFAQKMLPTLQHHLAVARQLQQTL